MNNRIEKYRKHIGSAFGVGCNVYDTILKEFENDADLFCTSCERQCDYRNTHLYGCYESVRWDDKYIYYCPCGFIYIAIPVYDENGMLGKGVITGPILMGNPEDFDVKYDLPNRSPSVVNDMTEVIAAIFERDKPKEQGKFSTTDFLNSIYKELDGATDGSCYPIELEKDLQKAIEECDSRYAREILNKLLGRIFFHSDGDFKKIKARALELIVILSRAAIEGGANIQQIFNLNNNYIEEVESFTNLEKLSMWLAGVINRYVSYVFEFSDVKHADIIYKITAYIKSNYMSKILLDDIAEHVYLSKTYVSKIFKEEMNITLSGYINKIRIEKSKALLLDSSLTIADVANLVGYEDQSYYTKKFKAITGISPGKYKEKHGMI